MKDLADADLVTAIVKASDHLKSRAEAQLRRHSLVVPFSVGIELLFVAKKHRIPYRQMIIDAARHFDMEQRDVLAAAAKALDRGEVATVFDAVHGAQALLRGVRLHTTDVKLHASPFPTTPF